MKKYLPGSLALITLILLVVSSIQPAPAGAKLAAWDLPDVAVGSHQVEGILGIANDFEVMRPVTVWSLGVFDHKGDGVQGGAVLTVRLYASNPDRARKRASGVLLETILFDAADAGQLVGGFRYKKLLRPVTLIPGQYTITADGFDAQNPEYKKDANPSQGLRPPVALNDGGGLIRFKGCSLYHIGYFLKRTRTAKDLEAAERVPDLYAAGTLQFSPAPEVVSPVAADYAMLTAGVKSFPTDTTNTPAGYRADYGSIALLEGNTFPVIIEPSGNRLILEAAGTYGQGSESGRCVAFAHEQWGHALGDNRVVLFENAIHWASRKVNPEDIVVGLSPNLSTQYFRGRGYQVRTIGSTPGLGEQNPLSGCDVVVVDFNGATSPEFPAQVAEFVAQGGGIVTTYLPRRTAAGGVDPLCLRVNTLLAPFGLAYRTGQTQPNDFAFTNLQAAPYPAALFNAFPAADLLRQDRAGQVRLDTLQKVIALNTLSYAADGRPDLLTALAAAYTGNTNNGIVGELSGGSTAFTEVAALAGAQANQNRLGGWKVSGSDLLSETSRGSVEYDFEVSAANVYRLQVFGSESRSLTNNNDFDLLLSVDGLPLGQYSFYAPQGVGTLLAMFNAKLGQNSLDVAYEASDRIECLTPFLSPGSHKLRVFWNNPNAQAWLRLQSIRVQSATGSDRDGNGMVDWVQALIHSQSGLDATNETLRSQISPACVEGRDPFPVLMRTEVAGADKDAPHLIPAPAPNGRWYVNVPLAAQGEITFQANYQNGARSEVRQIQWVPVNILDGGTYTVRDGDSLLLVARAAGSPEDDQGTSQLTIGDEKFSIKASAQMPYRFAGLRVASKGGIHSSQTVTIKGTYTSPDGVVRTGTITVNVIRHEFKNNPVCWAGHERSWTLTLPGGAGFEADQRLVVEANTEASDGGVETGLIIDQSEPRYFLSRVGTNGPVLSSGVAQGVDFWWAADTYLRSLKTFADGSELMETMLILNPTTPEVTVQMDVLVGGVVFEDGTTTKLLTRADFDALGRCTLRFIHPSTFKPSVCHSIKVLQDKAIVGQIW